MSEKSERSEDATALFLNHVDPYAPRLEFVVLSWLWFVALFRLFGYTSVAIIL